jgi:hypothetical protein
VVDRLLDRPERIWHKFALAALQPLESAPHFLHVCASRDANLSPNRDPHRVCQQGLLFTPRYNLPRHIVSQIGQNPF